MPTIADVLVKAHDELGKLETDIRAAMVNKHLADIVGSARGRLKDAALHPDARADTGELEQKKTELEKRNEPLAAQIARERPAHEVEWSTGAAPKFASQAEYDAEAQARSARGEPPMDPFLPRPALSPMTDQDRAFVQAHRNPDGSPVDPFGPRPSEFGGGAP
jgi:hypothetical protein